MAFHDDLETKVVMKIIHTQNEESPRGLRASNKERLMSSALKFFAEFGF